jgi:threonine/homoserine/homoserine lactone efflux protein
MRAAVAGLVCGFVVSVPVGPVNLTVINTALQRGFLPAFLAGLGAICAELIYAALMLAGHSTLLDNPQVVFGLRIFAVLVITGVGWRSLFITPEQIEAKSAAQIEKADARWHHPKSFLLGFVLTLSNLVLLLLWATLAAVLFAHDWVRPTGGSRWWCLAGVLTGATVWFFLLAFFVSRAHRRVRAQMLTKLARVCGVIFLIFAALAAYRLVRPATQPSVSERLLRRAE